jgi:hypothetical protein
MHEFESREDRGEQRSHLPTSRLYVHDKCGKTTEVSGYDFNWLANPFTWVSSTYCATCNGDTTLGRVRWVDTNEPISKYRARLRRNAPLSLIIFAYLVLPLLGIGLGGGIGWVVYTKRPEAGAFAGAILGLFIYMSFLTPLLSAWVWRLDYRANR